MLLQVIRNCKRALEPALISLGDAIRDARKARRMSQEQLALLQKEVSTLESQFQSAIHAENNTRALLLQAQSENAVLKEYQAAEVFRTQTLQVDKQSAEHRVSTLLDSIDAIQHDSQKAQELLLAKEEKIEKLQQDLTSRTSLLDQLTATHNELAQKYAVVVQVLEREQNERNQERAEYTSLLHQYQAVCSDQKRMREEIDQKRVQSAAYSPPSHHTEEVARLTQQLHAREEDIIKLRETVQLYTHLISIAGERETELKEQQEKNSQLQQEFDQLLAYIQQLLTGPNSPIKQPRNRRSEDTENTQLSPLVRKVDVWQEELMSISLALHEQLVYVFAELKAVSSRLGSKGGQEIGGLYVVLLKVSKAHFDFHNKLASLPFQYLAEERGGKGSSGSVCLRPAHAFIAFEKAIGMSTPPRGKTGDSKPTPSPPPSSTPPLNFASPPEGRRSAQDIIRNIDRYITSPEFSGGKGSWNNKSAEKSQRGEDVLSFHARLERYIQEVDEHTKPRGGAERAERDDAVQSSSPTSTPLRASRIMASPLNTSGVSVLSPNASVNISHISSDSSIYSHMVSSYSVRPTQLPPVVSPLVEGGEDIYNVSMLSNDDTLDYERFHRSYVDSPSK
ncbi:hypothetical protein EON65_29795 [archaeon]|nr:MAG: hypothetical protein EON65_29795 [archaeon]